MIPRAAVWGHSAATGCSFTAGEKLGNRNSANTSVAQRDDEPLQLVARADLLFRCVRQGAIWPPGSEVLVHDGGCDEALGDGVQDDGDDVGAHSAGDGAEHAQVGSGHGAARSANGVSGHGPCLRGVGVLQEAREARDPVLDVARQLATTIGQVDQHQRPTDIGQDRHQPRQVHRLPGARHLHGSNLSSASAFGGSCCCVRVHGRHGRPGDRLRAAQVGGTDHDPRSDSRCARDECQAETRSARARGGGGRALRRYAEGPGASNAWARASVRGSTCSGVTAGSSVRSRHRRRPRRQLRQHRHAPDARRQRSPRTLRVHPPTRSRRSPPGLTKIGMHRVAFSVDDIDEALEIAAAQGCHPLRGVATYGDVY